MKLQKSLISNDKGMAVFVALTILFIITIAGISLIAFASKEKQSSTDTTAIRNVVLTANAALSACENQFKLQPAIVRGILNKYKKDKTYKWLLVTDSSLANSEKKISLGNNGSSFSAMISAYDDTNQVLQITAIGYGRSNEQKTITAIYKLTGLKLSTAATSGGSKYALYLAADAKCFDCPVNVTGNMYTGTGFLFNGSSAGTTIHGTLKTASSGTSNVCEVNADNIVIDSAVYIGRQLKVSKSGFICKSNMAIEGLLTNFFPITIGGDLWMNGSNTGNIVMSSKTLHHSGSVVWAKVTGGIEDKKTATIPNIATQVGLGVDDTAWVFLQRAALISMSVLGPMTLDPTTLQTAYNNCPAASKYNGYAVIRQPSYGSNISAGTGTFSGKVILLINKSFSINGDFMNMTADSRILIYAYSKGVVSGFGGCYTSSFNGMIFAEDTSQVLLSWKSSPFNFNGAIHLAGKNVSWQLNSGSMTMNLTYNEAIISEFEQIGLIRRPGATGSGTSTTSGGSLEMTDVKIKSELLSVLY